MKLYVHVYINCKWIGEDKTTCTVKRYGMKTQERGGVESLEWNGANGQGSLLTLFE